MRLNCDLHCHSGYAGGVGNISFEDIERTMPLKGIDVVGTGDCLQKQWLDTLRDSLHEIEDGIFAPNRDSKVRYILEGEVIFTSPMGSHRKSVHHVFLFPSVESVEKARVILEKMDVKLSIGRPFIKCDGSASVARTLHSLHDIDPLVESFPAHVMTPDGIYGSKNPITLMEEFYGEGVDLLNAVETGLSADPCILGQIPELDGYTLLSNSDAHSSHLHRMGREFTTLDARRRGIRGIIEAIRDNGVCRTAEFNPGEGRYFLSGHRKGRVNHGKQYCCYSPGLSPENGLCPICKKKLTIGVLERSQILRHEQGGQDREWGYRPKNSPDFVHMVPLVEVIAYTRGIRSPIARSVLSEYHKVVGCLDNECSMWFMGEREIAARLDGVASEGLLENILNIKRGNFSFSPMGFDGTYGELDVGTRSDIFNVKEERIDSDQSTLLDW